MSVAVAVVVVVVAASVLQQGSISTDIVWPLAPVFPPIAKRRPSGIQAIPKWDLGSSMSGNASHLKRIPSVTLIHILFQGIAPLTV